MSRLKTILGVVAVLAVLLGAGCDSVDLKTAAEITDVSTGYYDNGLNDRGWNHMVPSVTFTLKNISDQKLSTVDVIVMYWATGQDSEQDEALIRVVGGKGLAAGTSAEPVVSRSKIGFSLEGPRAELFNNSRFVDWTVKLFLKRAGKILPAGEYPIERRILLNDPVRSTAK